MRESWKNIRELKTKEVPTKHRSFPSPHDPSERDHSISSAVLVQTASCFWI